MPLQNKMTHLQTTTAISNCALLFHLHTNVTDILTRIKNLKTKFPDMMDKGTTQ